MGAIKTGLSHIAEGAKGWGKGLGDSVAGLATLDFGRAAQGATEMNKGALTAVQGGIDLNPAVVCANTMLDGKVDNLMGRAVGAENNVAQSVATSMGNDANMVKTGIKETGKGIADGNLAEVGNGVITAGVGVASVAEDFTPSGAAMNVGMGVANTAMGQTDCKVTDDVIKVF